MTIRTGADTVVTLQPSGGDTLVGRFAPAQGKASSARAMRTAAVGATTGEANVPPAAVAPLESAAPENAASGNASTRVASNAGASGLSVAAAPIPVVNQMTYLSGAEVESLAKGRKWALRRLRDDARIVWDLREGGRLFGRNQMQNSSDAGQWLIDDRGAFCVRWRGNSTNVCLRVTQVAGGYRTWDAESPNALLHELTVERAGASPAAWHDAASSSGVDRRARRRLGSTERRSSQPPASSASSRGRWISPVV